MLALVRLRPLRVRPFALMMPEVTVKVRPSPSGLPTARTHSPTRSRSLSPSVARGETGGVDLQHRDIGVGIGADDLGGELTAVEQADGDLVGALDHMVVGEDVAILGHDEPGAAALLELRAPAGLEERLHALRDARVTLRLRVVLLGVGCLDEHDAGPDRFGHGGEGIAEVLQRRGAGNGRGLRRGVERLGRRLAGAGGNRLLGGGVTGQVEQAGEEQSEAKGEPDQAAELEPIQ